MQEVKSIFSLWNSGFNDEHPLLTGPFTLSDCDEGEYYELSRNPDYYYRYELLGTATTNTTTNLPNITSPLDINYGLLTIWLTAGFTAAILIVTVEISRRRTGAQD